MMQNHDLFLALPGQLFEAAAEFDFLGHVKLRAKTTQLAKGGSLTKDKRAGGPAERAADEIPETITPGSPGNIRFHLNGHTAANTVVVLDRGGDIRKKGWRGLRIGIHK